MKDTELIDKLCMARLTLEEAIAALRARLPLSNGSGGANLPLYSTMQEAYHVAAEMSAQGQGAWTVEAEGEGWRVTREEATTSNGDN